ncbi:MAG: hypothetical protein LBV26_00270 [Bacteroidales bacterium]|jgi:hypothetical protein|nr:hypothetical protein [Bacteroidales bacterium]
MALADIQQRIKAAFMASPVLQQAYGFDPGKPFDEQFSELSLEAGDINIFAGAQAVTEAILENDRAQVQSIIENNRIGTGPWYVSLAKQFQWSDSDTYFLAVDPETGIVHYNKTVPENRIITQAAYIENEGRIILKVASGARGNLHRLTYRQQLGLENYLLQMKIAGITVDVVSMEADELEVDCDVYYSPSYDVSQLQNAITAELDRYGMMLNYNGVIYRTDAVSTIKGVPGVVDVAVNGLYGLQGENRQEITRAYTTFSGYFNIKKTDGFPKINLIAE